MHPDESNVPLTCLFLATTPANPLEVSCSLSIPGPLNRSVKLRDAFPLSVPTNRVIRKEKKKTCKEIPTNIVIMFRMNSSCTLLQDLQTTTLYFGPANALYFSQVLCVTYFKIFHNFHAQSKERQLVFSCFVGDNHQIVINNI